MSETRSKFRPYIINVALDPRDEGGWLWAIHSNGKLIQKSRRKLISEAQAKRDAQGAMEMLLEDRRPD